MTVFQSWTLLVNVLSVVFRFGSAQRSLQQFDPHVTVDVSSGESSSGFTSQESTMERNKSGKQTELLCKNTCMNSSPS